MNDRRSPADVVALPVRTEQADSAARPATELDSEGVPPVQSAKNLARLRIDTAEVFDELLEQRWDAGDRYSNRELAERYIGVDERTIRKWRDGEKPIPAAALLALPLPLAKDFVDRIFAKRVGGLGKRSTALLAESLDQIALLVTNDYVIDADSIDSKLEQASRDIARIRSELSRRKR